MITDVTPDIFTDTISSKLIPMYIQERIKRECGHFILLDEIMQSEKQQAKQIALQFLQKPNRVAISPFNLKKAAEFLDKIIYEAEKCTSRCAIELSLSLHNLFDELLLNPEISETSPVITTFIKNFQRFSRNYLEAKGKDERT